LNKLLKVHFRKVILKIIALQATFWNYLKKSVNLYLKLSIELVIVIYKIVSLWILNKPYFGSVEHAGGAESLWLELIRKARRETTGGCQQQ